MDHDRLTRRRFIVAAVALSGAAGIALKPGLFPISRAWAESPGQVGVDVRRAMVRMARLLYPHDALADEVYAGILDRALSDIAAGEGFARQLDEAAAALDDRSGGDWQDLDPAAQVRAMREIETQPFFTAIQGAVQYGIYNAPEFWEHVGYPGPSKDFGGYLNRGAGDIDWLPEES
jgi:hypothetical protein